jgi:hypothetical protein
MEEVEALLEEEEARREDAMVRMWERVALRGAGLYMPWPTTSSCLTTSMVASLPERPREGGAAGLARLR